MNHPYTIKLADGKYTIINHGPQLEFLRNGQPYLANIPVNSDEVLAMAQRIEELEVAVRAVLEGSLCAWGRMDDGMVKGHADPAFTALWQATLRSALEQKP